MQSNRSPQPAKKRPRTHRSSPSPERNDVVALSHGHADHLGETTLELCRRHRPSIVAINELSWWLEGRLGAGHDFQRMNKGGTQTVRGVRISMTDARHSSSVWPDVPVIVPGIGEAVDISALLE